MTEINLDIVKNYLRITDTDEDQILQSFIDGAVIFTKHYVANNVDFTNLPQDLLNAILDHVAFLYENRGTDNATETPSRIVSIYKKYKKFRLF